MRSKSWLAAAAVLFVLVVLLTCAARAQGPVTPGGKPLSLYDMLSKGLRARRPVDFEYCRLIADKVEAGELPLHMVHGTFFYAYKKYRRPLQYFQQALHLRAKKAGLYAPSLSEHPSTAETTGPITTGIQPLPGVPTP
ncbi:MAG: hypothetical protein K2Y37_24825 [Pirellulales bacterium]|nr:hypothetical protein [Pirellulales bacterium]